MERKAFLDIIGYDIEVANKSDFIEVVNLLIYGGANKDQLAKYKRLISRHTLLQGTR